MYISGSMQKEPEIVNCRNTKHYTPEIFRKALSEVFWEHILTANDPNTMFELWLDQFTVILDQIATFNPISAGRGGGGWNPPLEVSLAIAPSRNNLKISQLHSLSGGHVITLLSEALCFTTYISLYLHRIVKFYLFCFLTFIPSFD